MNAKCGVCRQRKTAAERCSVRSGSARSGRMRIHLPTRSAFSTRSTSVFRRKTAKKSRPAESTAKKRSAGGRYSTPQEEEPERANRSRISTAGAVTLGILTGVLIGTVIYGRVQTNEIYTEIASLQAEYDDLVARNISMRSEMEGKLTVKNIEEYAEKTLGLMPLNQSQIEYIQLQTEDEVTITEPEDNFFVSINDYLVSIWEYLRGK